MDSKPGKVIFIGTGPGDPCLLTIKALHLIEDARIAVYDSLVSDEILSVLPVTAERIPVRTDVHERGMTPAEIGNVMVSRASSGQDVLRLKSGDPMIFARTGEEMEVLEKNGIDYEIVPGITSAIAAADLSKTVITDRRFSSSVAIVTGHETERKSEKRVDWVKIADSMDTVIVLMGISTLPSYLSDLIRGGMKPEARVTLVFDVSRKTQRIIRGTAEKVINEMPASCGDLCTVIINKNLEGE